MRTLEPLFVNKIMRTLHHSSLALLALATVITFAGQKPGHAQDAPPAPPPRPYVSQLKGDFTLLEKMVYKPKPPPVPAATAAGPDGSDEAPPAGPQLVEMDVAQTGAVRRDKQIFADGTSSEIWRSGALRFLMNSKSPDGVAVASHEMSYYDDPVDFKEVAWVGPKFYKGVQALGDKTCYYYEQGGQKAWIDQTTRWPLQYDTPALHITYTYGTPNERLQLPPVCAKKVDQMRRAWAGMPTH